MEPIKKPRKQNRKSNQAEVALRVYAIYQLILQGYDNIDLYAYGAQKWNGLGEAQVREYIYQAREIIKNNTSTNAADYLQTEIKRSQMLMSKCVAKGEHHIALEVMRDLRKLLGLYPAEKMRHIMDGKIQTEVVQKADLSKLTDEDLKKLVEKLSNT